MAELEHSNDVVGYGMSEMMDMQIYLTPGYMVREFALAERAKGDGHDLLFAGRTYWCDPCLASGCTSSPSGRRLAGLVQPVESCNVGSGGVLDKRYSWWTHKAYADLAGTFANVSAPVNLDGLATRLDSTSSAQALLGGFGSHDSTLTVRFLGLRDIDGLVINDVIQVEAQHIPGDSSLAILGGVEPETIIDGRRLVFGDSLEVTITGFHDYDAITIKLTPIVPATVPAPG